MSSRGRLVALREYTENIRTKTFWIGILAFPVILMLMIFVPHMLEGVRDVRRYAVIDESGWLLEAVDQRADSDDLYQTLVFLQGEALAGEAAINALPEQLQVPARLLEGLTNEALIERARLATQLGGGLLGQASGEQEGPRPEPSAEQERQATEVMIWMLSSSAKHLRKLGAGLKREDYERIEVPSDVEDPEEYLRGLLERGQDGLFAYFVIGEEPKKEGSPGCKYVSNNLTDEDLRDWFSRLATEEVVSLRFEEAEIDQDVARRIQARVEFEKKQLGEEGEEEAVSIEDRIRQWAPVAFVYLLWISIFTIVQMLLTNTIEEKSNRIIEVLLSSVSPLQLMSGKIVGIALTGLTMIGSWVVFFILALEYMPGWLGWQELPDFTVLIRQPIYLISFVVYFLMGYFFYAAILVGLGSVCNSIKEAQNLYTPIMIVMFVPFVAMIPVAKDPNGTLARVLTYIPPLTPFTMMNRAAGPPEAWEYVVTTVLMLVSIALAFWGAAKIFRIGVLMTGKPPKPTDILRWLRAPVGHVPDESEVGRLARGK